MNKELFDNIEILFTTKVTEIVQSVSQEDYDAILDSRDSDEFSTNWMKVYDEVKSMLNHIEIDSYYINKIESLRERTFKSVIERAQSSDLAAYISDDLALLLEAVICNFNDSWLNGLLREYSLGKIPRGEILLVEGDLVQVI